MQSENKLPETGAIFYPNVYMDRLHAQTDTEKTMIKLIK